MSEQSSVLVWLPGPMGDAILAVPALRALRNHLPHANITFFARPVVRQVLDPCRFTDGWLPRRSGNPFSVAATLRQRAFTRCVLMKNSFGSALTAFLAGIPERIGYARQGRSLFLTQKLQPQRLPDGKYKPISMIDYYLQLAALLGAETDDRTLELAVDLEAKRSLLEKLPQIRDNHRPLVVLVPGGAFGPSKRWPAKRFAATADRLVSRYDATVVISVADDPVEKQIARRICDSAKSELINLGERPISLAELKALFGEARLVITNDTGPRHIAIALGRKVVTLFGPNDPAWTETGWEDEIKIVGDAPCVPCQKPTCAMSEHLCMRSISVEMVLDAAEKLLQKDTAAQMRGNH